MNMHQHEYTRHRPQLENMSSIDFGLKASTAGIVAYALLFLFRLLSLKVMEVAIPSQMIYWLSIVADVIHACVLVVFFIYLANFRMPIVRASIVAYLLVWASMLFFREVYLYWLVIFVYGVAMIIAKGDYIGGIRRQGIVTVIAVLILIGLAQARTYLATVDVMTGRETDFINNLALMVISAIHAIQLFLYASIFGRAINYNKLN